MAYQNMVWYGMVWYGMVWYGMVWYGIVFHTGLPQKKKITVYLHYWTMPIYRTLYVFYLISARV